ncbi:MAG: hypothetical protein KFH87_10920 [Bacteroidetes bacterium]|nr:hypothetical protein [Bacteroidota bacterium]
MQFSITLPYHHSEQELDEAIRGRIGDDDATYRILKRSVDARQHHDIRVHYSVTTDSRDPVDDIQNGIEQQRRRLETTGQRTASRPVVVGSGPGGLFCAYWLHLHGIQPILIEQGPPMRERIRDMARFMKNGVLHPYSNICFGAGGAGTYSDGKLITRIRSPYIGFVMDTFVRYGAPDNICFLYNPHLGSNKIRQCITRMLDDLTEKRMDIRYGTRFTDYDTDSTGAIRGVQLQDGTVLPATVLFLATGHSAREVYRLLRSRTLSMSLKEFALGVRIEHPAEAVNTMQYGQGYSTRYPGIEAAQYRLANTWKDTNRAVYSFCMCPGGYVLNASSDTTGVVTNGMSNSMKSGRFSNAAIVVNVSVTDLERTGYTGIDAALQLQVELEARFRAAVNRTASVHVLPGQRLQDFLAGQSSHGLLPTSCVSPVAPAPMHMMFPDFVYEGLCRGFGVFDRKMRGFARHEKAQIFGIESRTSAPYRIDRDQHLLTSPDAPNLYPVGEGAGYAGGITSAAVDGIRAAQAWLWTMIEPADCFTAMTGSRI